MKSLNLKSPLWLICISIIAFFAIDSLIFRTGFYDYYLANYRSSTVLLKIKYSQEHETKDKPNIFIPSASLLWADFSLPYFEKKNPNAPFTVLPFVVVGTGAYTQYHLLKEIDPTHQKYHTIIIPLESYKILSSLDPRDDSAYEEARRVASFIKYREFSEFLREYKGTDIYNKLIFASLFANRDYLANDFIALSPKQIIQQNRRSDDENYHLFYEGDSNTTSISGLKLNAKNEIISCPASLDFCSKRIRLRKANDPRPSLAEQKAERQKVLDYQKKWLTKLVDLYKDSPTQIIFIQMPHAFIDANRVPLPDTPDLRDILPTHNNVHFLNEHYFDVLNQYQYMHDDQHLNKKGSEIFTDMLTELLYKFVQNKPLPKIISKEF